MRAVVLNAANALAGLGLGSDSVPPASVSNLAIAAATHRAVTLRWTRPGDDGSAGTPALYDVRYAESRSPSPTSAPRRRRSASPSPTSRAQQPLFTIDGLFQGHTYWFAMRALDESGNASGLSERGDGHDDGLTATRARRPRWRRADRPGGSELPEPLACDRHRCVGSRRVRRSRHLLGRRGARRGHSSPRKPSCTDADGVAETRLTLGNVPPHTAGVLHRVSASAPGPRARSELRAGAHCARRSDRGLESRTSLLH
jgi:hypothetical protein